MDIGIFGATGTIGGRVLAEAVARGHRGTGFTRSQARIPADGRNGQGASWAVVNILDVDQVAKAISGLDVVVNAINAGDDIPETIANADVLPAAARSLLTALDRNPSVRLIVIGGAGSLEAAPGQQVADVDGFADSLPDAIGTPPEYVTVVEAHREALRLYRLSNRNWTYISPSALLVQPGARTGRFRIGGNQLLVKQDGTPDISAEDLAMAVVDEAELARHVGRRFTVGY